MKGAVEVVTPEPTRLPDGARDHERCEAATLFEPVRREGKAMNASHSRTGAGPARRRRCGVGVLALLAVVAVSRSGAARQPCKLDPEAPGFQADAREAAELRTIRRWMAAHLAKARARHPEATFVFLGLQQNDAGTIVEQRNSLDGACREGYWVVQLTLDRRRCALSVEQARPYAENCCPSERCPDRTPAGWMLELFRRSKADDTKGLLALISPSSGYQETLAPPSEGEGGTRTFTRRQGRRAAKAISSAWDPIENLDCPAAFSAAGDATCSTGRSGSLASYRWKRTGDGAYLLSYAYEDTGE
ncbi:MAG: hypothetical protein IPL40_13595 [Proteobacteria bacterium]|nr:hypothetical protein [Pseudomonadota bacterium]